MLRQWVAMQERRAEPLYMPAFGLIVYVQNLTVVVMRKAETGLSGRAVLFLYFWLVGDKEQRKQRHYTLFLSQRDGC